jgi:hypothetical protein
MEHLLSSRNLLLFSNQNVNSSPILAPSFQYFFTFSSASYKLKHVAIILGNYGGVRLAVYREAFQDLQGQEVLVHADGVLPGRRALDNPQVSLSYFFIFLF